MSFKEPVDAFASNPLAVVFGPDTRANGKGLSILDIAAGLVVLWFTVRLALRNLPDLVRRYAPWGWIWLGWIAGSLLFGLAFIIVFFAILPPILDTVNAFTGRSGYPSSDSRRSTTRRCGWRTSSTGTSSTP